MPSGAARCAPLESRHARPRSLSRRLRGHPAAPPHPRARSRAGARRAGRARSGAPADPAACRVAEVRAQPGRGSHRQGEAGRRGRDRAARGQPEQGRRHQGARRRARGDREEAPGHPAARAQPAPRERAGGDVGRGQRRRPHARHAAGPRLHAQGALGSRRRAGHRRLRACRPHVGRALRGAARRRRADGAGAHPVHARHAHRASTATPRCCRRSWCRARR